MNIFYFIEFVPARVLQIPISPSEMKMQKCFIPRRESAKAEPEGVLLSILYFIEFLPARVHEIPISRAETEMPKCSIVWMDGWVGGWMDGWTGGDFLTPSNFLI